MYGLSTLNSHLSTELFLSPREAEERQRSHHAEREMSLSQAPLVDDSATPPDRKMAILFGLFLCAFEFHRQFQPSQIEALGHCQRLHHDHLVFGTLAVVD